MATALLEKNLLDIEERTYSGYFTTLIIASLTVITILTGLLTAPALYSYRPLLLLVLIIPLWTFHAAFGYKNRADATIERLKRLNV